MRKQNSTQHTREKRLESVFTKLLGEIEPNTLRQGVKETPLRAAKAMLFATQGYDQDPTSALKCFEVGAESFDEMVMVKDIPFYSRCEHHLEPIIGRATIGYLPDGKIVGLSKLARVTDIFARRLQVQERMTVDIASCIMGALSPRGVGVQIRARHLCMEARGVCKHGCVTVTNALQGNFRDRDVRKEFLKLAESNAAI
jgi:GTP cyclohydrolase IA